MLQSILNLPFFQISRLDIIICKGNCFLTISARESMHEFRFFFLFGKIIALADESAASQVSKLVCAGTAWFMLLTISRIMWITQSSYS